MGLSSTSGSALSREKWRRGEDERLAEMRTQSRCIHRDVSSKTFVKILGKALAFPQGRTKRLRPILFKSERAGWPQLMPELQFIRDPCEQIEIWNWSYWCQSVKRAVFIYQSPALLKINVPREPIDNWRDKGGKANVYIYIYEITYLWGLIL